MKILIVDDEHIILNGISLMIQKKLDLDFPVETAISTNVPDALEIMRHFSPDLVLTDIRMPVMDGFDLIRSAKEISPDCAVAIITSHADFSYAQYAIQYEAIGFLLKPVETDALKNLILKVQKNLTMEAEKQYQENLKSIRDILLYDFPLTDLNLDSGFLSQYFPYEYFTVCILYIESDKNISLSYFESQLLMVYPKCFALHFRQKHQYVAVCNHPLFRVNHTPLFHNLSVLQSDHKLYWGVSIVSNSFEELHSLYLNAHKRLLYHKAFGNDTKASEISLCSYQDCISLFMEQDACLFDSKLDDYLKRLNLHPNCPVKLLRDIYQCFFVNIRIYLETSGISQETAPISVPDIVSDISSLKLAIKERIFAQRELFFPSENYNSTVQTLHRLLDFIDQNYMKDISLEILAEAVNMHPNYVCSLFSQKLGQSFLKCLHLTRIRKAKDLLVQNSSLSIEAVGLKVGYTSSNQFSRIFRKYENCSPSDYRKLME